MDFPTDCNLLKHRIPFDAKGRRHLQTRSRRLEAFEQRHGVVLPESYRSFLLRVTDGGAGPGYGLFALERRPGDDVAEDLSLLSTPFPEAEFFGIEPPEALDEDGDEDVYENAMEVYWREMPGTLTLCHYGCGIRAYLVVTGPRPGLVLLDQRCDPTERRPHAARVPGAVPRLARRELGRTEGKPRLGRVSDRLQREPAGGAILSTFIVRLVLYAARTG